MIGMAQPTASELVISRQEKIMVLLQKIAVWSNGKPRYTLASYADAGDLQRVIDGLTEALRVLTNGEG